MLQISEMLIRRGLNVVQNVTFIAYTGEH